MQDGSIRIRVCVHVNGGAENHLNKQKPENGLRGAPNSRGTKCTSSKFRQMGPNARAFGSSRGMPVVLPARFVQILQATRPALKRERNEERTKRRNGHSETTRQRNGHSLDYMRAGTARFGCKPTQKKAHEANGCREKDNAKTKQRKLCSELLQEAQGNRAKRSACRAFSGMRSAAGCLCRSPNNTLCSWSCSDLVLLASVLEWLLRGRLKMERRKQG